MENFVACNYLCGHFDCESKRATYVAKYHHWGLPQPQQPAPECCPPPPPASRPRRLRVPRVREMQRVHPVVTYAQVPQLGFKFVLPAHREVYLRRVAEQPPERRPTAIKIAGVMCPPIRGNWMMYIQRKGEATRTYVRRVRGMVAARHLAREVKEERRVEDLTPTAQLRIACLGVEQRLPLFHNLREQVLDGPDTGYVWTKIKCERKLRSPRIKNLAGARYADECLARKIALSKANEKLRAEIARRRQQRRAVVLIDRRTHVYQGSLANALINSFYSVAKQNPQYLDAFDFDGEVVGQGPGDDLEKDAHGMDTETKTDKKSNVVMEDKESASLSKPLPKTPKIDVYSCVSVEPTKVAESTFTDRWLELTKGTWTSQKEGDQLFTFDLPRDLLNLDRFKTSPNFALFKNHVYWRGNMKIKMIVNANSRQMGMLQLRFYNCAFADKNFSNRNNIYSGSQMPHALINASFSNTAILDVPFQYINPLLTVSKGSTTWDFEAADVGPEFANLGKLVCLVMVPLTVAQTTPLRVGYSVLISMEDSQFAGLIDSRLVDNTFKFGQMFALGQIVKTANAVAESLDPNRDNPTFNCVGLPMIPVNSSSWCHGTGIGEYSNVLRLNPNPVTPYAPGRAPPIDEMTVKYLSSVYSLFKILTVRSSTPGGALLFKFDASPLLSPNTYPRVSLSTGDYGWSIPAVGVVASMFAWWRGSLNLRIDVVGSVEITGRLLVAYVPRYYKDIDIHAALNCNCAIYDIQRENRQFVFKIPFMSDRPFWDRPQLLEDEFEKYPSPGTVYIFNYQELIANSTIPDSVRLMCYIAGGDDFEVSVPACPIIGNSFYPHIKVDPEATLTIQPREQYYPLYTGTYHVWVGWAYRYSAYAEHVAQFEYKDKAWKEILYQVAKLESDHANSDTIKFTFKIRSGDMTKEIETSGLYNIFVRDTGDYVYGASLGFSSEPTEAVLAEFDKFLDGEIKAYVNNLGQHQDLGDFFSRLWQYMYENEIIEKFLIAEYKIASIDGIFPELVKPSAYWEPKSRPFFKSGKRPRGQAPEERKATDAKLTAPISGACMDKTVSRVMYGERFFDLKDFARRYHLYAKGSVDFGTKDIRLRTLLLKFPALPQGLDLTAKSGETSDPYWNRTREGVIPLIASGYRFYSGGLRFRVVFDISKASGLDKATEAKIFVQHRPDVMSNSLSVTIRSASEIGQDDIELPGYASYHQFDSVNNVISVEIPYYAPCVKLLLQRPVDNDAWSNRWSTLGQVALGVTFANEERLNCSYEIYYALADDSRFSVFCGFPPMIDLTQIPITPLNLISTSRSGFVTVSGEIPSNHLLPRLHPARKARALEPVKVVEVKESAPEAFEFGEDSKDQEVQVFNRFRQPNSLEQIYLSYKGKRERFLSLEEFSKFFPRYTAVTPYSWGVPKFYYVETRTDSTGRSWYCWLDAKASVQGQGISDWMPWSSTAKAVDNISKVDPDKVNSALDSVKDVGGFMSNFKETMKGFIPTIEGIKNKMEKYMSLVINLVTNLVHCLLNLNIRSVIVAIVSIFSQIKLVSISFSSKIVDSMYNLFNSLSSLKQKEEESGVPEVKLPETPVGEGPDDEIFDIKEFKKEEEQCQAAYLSTLIAGVAAALGVGLKVMNGVTFKSMLCYLLDGIKSFCMTANCLFTFIKNNLICVQKIGNWFIDDTPKVKDIAFLKNEQEEIYKWALEVLEYIDPWKEQVLFSSIRKASRVHELSFSGSIIMTRLSGIQLTSQQYRMLEKLMERLNKLKERLVKAHMAPPVRFEPFVYELTGPTATGKSTILQRLPIELLKQLNMKFEGEVIYHRQVGSQWWNGCVNQPVCSVDEKFPIMKPGFDDVQLAELFQLKSRCVFNPPMPDLPDKNLRYNPLIVQYASNNAFPPLIGLLDPTAVFRRRDVLVYVQFTQRMREKYAHMKVLEIKNLDYEDRRNFNCLEFYFAENPADEQTRYQGPHRFDDFLYLMKTKFYQYYFNEEMQFKRHLQLALSLQPEMGDEMKLSAFDEMWRDMVDLRTGEESIREFRKTYHELVAAKDLLVEQRQSKMMAAIRKVTGQQDDLSEVEIKEKIKTFREKLVKSVSDNIKGLPKDKIISPKKKKEEVVVGQGPSVGDIERTMFAQVKPEHLDQHIKDTFQIFKDNRDKICPHNMMMMLQQIYPDLFKFDRDTQAWVISQEDFEHCLTSISGMGSGGDINQKFSIGDFKLCSVKNNNYKHEWKNEKWYVFHEPCVDYDACIFKDSYTRNKATKHLLTLNRVSAEILKRHDLAKLAIYAPRTFMEDLKEQIEASMKEFSKEEHSQLKEEVKEVKTWYQNLREKVMSIEWKKWFQRLAIVLGVFFFFGAIFKMWGFMNSPDPQIGAQACSAGIAASIAGAKLAAVGEVHASGDYKQGSTKKESPRQVANKVLESLPRGQMDCATMQNLQNILKRNTIYLEIHDGAGKFKIFRCFGICGRTALTYDHAWEAINNFSKANGSVSMYLMGVAQKLPTACKLELNELQYERFKDSSLGLITLPLRFPLFRDIRSRIAPKIFHQYQNGIGIIVESDAKKVGDSVEWDWHHHHVDYSISAGMKVKGGHFFSDFEMADGFRYRNFSGAGKCGSVLMSTTLQQPIVGMHVAGSETYGYAEAIYKEMFDHLSNCNEPSQNVLPTGNGDSEWFVDGEVIGVGCVSRFLAARANEKSRIIPSKVQNDPDSPFPVYTDVSVLTPKDPRIKDAPFSPMLEGCKFHGKPLKQFNEEHLKIAIEDYNNKVLAKCIPERLSVGILPVELAIGGIEGCEGYEHIEWNSSEGFPFVAHRRAGHHNKRWLFNFDEQGRYVSHDSMLEDEMKRKWMLRNNNIIPDTIFTDCLKDCRVAKEKVLQPGKTRIFSIAPVDFTIQQRQCTLDFVVSFMKHRMELEHSIGINPDSREWALLAQNLLTKGDSILTGDYSKFGDTIPCQIVHAFFKLIADWYEYNSCLTKEHSQQLKIMAYEIANSKHLMFNLVYQVLCGQPSGNSLTVLLNSYANSIYMRLAWLSIMENSKFSTLEDLHKHTKFYSYGDDIICSLSDEIKDVFNAQSLCEFFGKYNLKFTNADKGNEIVPYTNLSEADFLKRGFAPHPFRKSPQVVLAPLKEESIIDTVNWVNKDSFGRDNPNCESYISMSIQVCEDALRNSFGRGPKFYNDFKTKLTLFWRKHHKTFVAPTWEQLDTRVFDQGEILVYYFRQ